MSCHPHDTSTGDGGESNDAKLQFNSELNNHRLYENDDEDENFKISDL